MYIWIRFGIKSVRDKYSVVTYQSKIFVKCIFIIVNVNENRFSLFLLVYCNIILTVLYFICTFHMKACTFCVRLGLYIILYVPYEVRSVHLYFKWSVFANAAIEIVKKKCSQKEKKVLTTWKICFLYGIKRC
jgi:hypothetical protein